MATLRVRCMSMLGMVLLASLWVSSGRLEAQPLNPYAGIPSFGGGLPGAGVGLGGGFGAGQGALLNSYSGLGGIGALGLGGYGGYGAGGIFGAYNPYYYGALSNPYTGFLSGVASVTKANADYLIGQEQAKLLRQQGIKAAIENSKRLQEAEEWFRERNRGNGVKQREDDERQLLEWARRTPSMSDIWSARALNVLLKNLIVQQSQGEKGPKVPIPEEVLRSINLTVGSSRANMGLLRNVREKGKLSWPLVLQDPRFADARDKIDENLLQADKAIRFSQPVDPGTLKDLNANVEQLRALIRGSVSDLSPQQYVEAKRYLGMVEDAVKGLEDPNVTNISNQKWFGKAGTAAELVKFMNDNGFQFAPAVPGDEPAYKTLYTSLAAYDAGMTSLASK